MAPRQPVEIRLADVDDAAGLIELWRVCATAAVDEGSEAFTQQSLWREPSVAEAREALEFNGLRAGRRVVVAVHGEQIIGAAAGDITTLTPIAMSKVLILSDIQVLPGHRRRSVASSLLGTMASYAEENGCEMLAAAIPAYAKEPNRYLTKLGFNQIAVVRAIPMAKLNARLTTKSFASRETGRLMAVRRSLRRHAVGR